ncbi:hypothetical protein JCM5350_002195 [Sporobolomyces pararoseus]
MHISQDYLKSRPFQSLFDLTVFHLARRPLSRTSFSSSFGSVICFVKELELIGSINMIEEEGLSYLLSRKLISQNDLAHLKRGHSDNLLIYLPIKIILNYLSITLELAQSGLDRSLHKYISLAESLRIVYVQLVINGRRRWRKSESRLLEELIFPAFTIESIRTTLGSSQSGVNQRLHLFFLTDQTQLFDRSHSLHYLQSSQIQQSPISDSSPNHFTPPVKIRIGMFVYARWEI